MDWNRGCGDREKSVVLRETQKGKTELGHGVHRRHENDIRGCFLTYSHDQLGGLESSAFSRWDPPEQGLEFEMPVLNSVLAEHCKPALDIGFSGS